MNSKQKITIDQQSSSSSPVIGHTDPMIQQPTLFDDQQQQQQLRPIIVPPSTIPTTTTTTIKSSSSKKNDIEHFVSHDDRSLRKQQERDDMLLQKEKERMSRDRLNRNKDPVVVSISQKSSSNSATASAMKRIKKTIDRMRSLNQVESEKNRNQYESNDEGDEGDDNNYDSDAASDESDADGEYFDESIMIRRNKPTTVVAAAAAEKAGTITEKAEKTSNENKRCKNTVSGHDLVTDSRGFTCYASDLSTRTMCCRHSTLYSNTLDESRVKQVEKQGQDDGEEKDSKQEQQEENKTITTEAKRYSCDTCHSQYQCCESYEYCVSCCLKPQNRPMIEQLHKKYLSQQKLLYTRIRTAFDFCAARCRTNSNSVVNENRYRTHWKHCFGAKDPADIFSSSSSR